MATQTLEQLRALAKSLGLKGYSKLAKDKLRQRVARAKSTRASKRAGAPTRAKMARRPTKPAKQVLPARSTRVSGAPQRNARMRGAPSTNIASKNIEFASQEERVEGAKYALAPAGVVTTPPPLGNSLWEDIEHLPAIPQPMLCLLSQKPGVLHAYWALPALELKRHPDLKLRLCGGRAEGTEVWQEIGVASERGHWYFHVNESATYQDVYVQLGFYRDGNFINAVARGAVRIPNLYATQHIDRRWWFSDETFRSMYLRSGGFADRHGLAWSHTGSSPAGGPMPGERLIWPGSSSSG